MLKSFYPLSPEEITRRLGEQFREESVRVTDQIDRRYGLWWWDEIQNKHIRLVKAEIRETQSPETAEEIIADSEGWRTVII